ncbi:MAG TPA: DUF4403 family protein [Longimicrobiales bacterium]|nr:DUF4403 family protein [Longimicrobiales bacterium]
MRSWVSLAAAVSLLACGRKGEEIDAPAPALSADADSMPTLPPSIIDASITYDLTPVVAALEKAVPRRFGDLDARHELPGNSRVHFAFAARRDPFRVSIDGSTARMASVIHYQGRGWYDPPLAPEVSGSCGTGDEAAPRARVELSSVLSLTSTWRLRSRTTVRPVEAFSEADRDQCRVTFLKIDVTDKVIGAAQQVLEEHRGVVDERVASVDLRSKFQKWWGALQRPIRLTDSVWLRINPQAVQLGPLAGKGTTLVATVRLTAAPRIVTGARPEAAPVPLPALGKSDGGDGGFHVLVEGVLDYDAASRLLARALEGKRIEKAGQAVMIHGVRVYGIGRGRLAVELRVRGAFDGTIYLIGTPQYNGATGELHVPDLDFEVESANLLADRLGWLKKLGLREELIRRARWPTAGLLRHGEEQLLKGLNRNISQDAKLTVDVERTRVVGVRALRRAIVVRAEVTGRARLDISRENRPQVAAIAN